MQRITFEVTGVDVPITGFHKLRCRLYSVLKACSFIVGVDDGEGTPVPIPNTAVKLTGADDTWLEAAWDNRKTPTQKQTVTFAVTVCFCALIPLLLFRTLTAK